MSTKKTPRHATGQHRVSFADHVGELRVRFTIVILFFLIASSIAYAFRDVLVAVVLAPVGDQKLIYLTPAGGFAFIFQITMYAGALASAPVFVYHLYGFVKPALPTRATRFSLRVLIAATCLMIAGVCFGYFVAVPAALHFLTDFAGEYVTSSLTADSYLNFVVAYVVGLGVLFQLPLLLMFWNWISPIKPGGLLNSQRFVVIGAFIAAAIITPTPDILNQSMVAVPIIGIYQLGVVVVFVSNRRLRRQQKKAVIQQRKTTALAQKSFVSASQPVPSSMQVRVAQPSLRKQARVVDGFHPVRPIAASPSPNKPHHPPR